jgi:hypothetical protein
MSEEVHGWIIFLSSEFNGFDRRIGANSCRLNPFTPVYTTPKLANILKSRTCLKLVFWSLFIMFLPFIQAGRNSLVNATRHLLTSIEKQRGQKREGTHEVGRKAVYAGLDLEQA